MKEKLEILFEEISIWWWSIFHKKKFLEKYRESSLVNPKVIVIHRTGFEEKQETEEVNFTPEEIEEIRKGLMKKAEEYHRGNDR